MINYMRDEMSDGCVHVFARQGRKNTNIVKVIVIVKHKYCHFIISDV